MVHLIGSKLIPGKAPHTPVEQVVVEKTTTFGSTTLTIKTGIESISATGWKVWQRGLFQDNKAYLAYPPQGFSQERAILLASAAADFLALTVGMCIAEMQESAVREQRERDAIDKAVLEKG